MLKPRLHVILPSGFLTSVFPHQNTACISLLSHAYQMPRQSHGNYICSAVQIIKLLTMLFPHPVVSRSSSLPRNFNTLFSVSFQASWDTVTTEVRTRTTATHRIVVDQLLASLYWMSYVDARPLDLNWSQKKWEWRCRKTVLRTQDDKLKTCAFNKQAAVHAGLAAWMWLVTEVTLASSNDLTWLVPLIILSVNGRDGKVGEGIATDPTFIAQSTKFRGSRYKD